MSALPDRDTYFDEWARLHGGHDPRSSRLVGGWLSLTYAVARPLAAAGVQPDIVTVVAVAVAAGAVPLAVVGGSWLWLAAALVVASGLLDNLDGAVAVLTGRASRWGYVLDSLADRLADALYAAVLWQAGAPGLVAAAGAGLALLQEYARARAGSAGMQEIGVVTVFERPTRVIVTAVFLACAAVLGAQWATLGAAAWAGLGLIGLAQLLLVVRRRLR